TAPRQLPGMQPKAAARAAEARAGTQDIRRIMSKPDRTLAHGTGRRTCGHLRKPTKSGRNEASRSQVFEPVAQRSCRPLRGEEIGCNSPLSFTARSGITPPAVAAPLDEIDRDRGCSASAFIPGARRTPAQESIGCAVLAGFDRHDHAAHE